MKWKQLWETIKAHIVTEDPDQPQQPEIPEHPRHGITMEPGRPDQEFVLRLGDGTYYAGPGMTPREIQRTPRLENAARFPNRWAALQAAATGPVFANAGIVAITEIQPLRTAGARH